MALLDDVKVACRVKSTAFDDELSDLILAAYGDLGLTDILPSYVEYSDYPSQPLIKQAVITYCKMHFGFQANDYYERLKASYDEQKAQLLMSSEFTDWGDGNA
jgi:hypothetical protein